MLVLDKITAELMGETIVKDFQLQLNVGEVISLYGPSGCGKTTILRLIANIIDLESGSITNGFMRTTYLFQEHRLLPWRTAWENIALVLPTQVTESNQQQITTLLTHLALEKSDWHKYPHELSGGMRQRVALGRALINQPDLLLMDEPFSALDFELKQTLQNLILDRVINEKMSIILVTHDRYEALYMADYIYLLSDHKPTTCKRIISLDTPYHQRDAHFIESHLSPNFWRVTS